MTTCMPRPRSRRGSRAPRSFHTHVYPASAASWQLAVGRTPDAAPLNQLPSRPRSPARIFAACRFGRYSPNEGTGEWRPADMGDPQVFISCVSSEFRTVGRAVADVPLRLGYTSVTQEVLARNWPGGPGDRPRSCCGRSSLREHQACDAHAAAPPSPQTDPGQGTAVPAPPPASPAGSSVDPFPTFLLLIRSRHDGKRGGILRKRGDILRTRRFRRFGRCGGSSRKTAVSSCGGREWDKYDTGGGSRIHLYRAGWRTLPGVKTHSCPCSTPPGSGPATLCRPSKGAFTSRCHKRV